MRVLTILVQIALVGAVALMIPYLMAGIRETVQELKEGER